VTTPINTPIGTVFFYDGATILGSATLDGTGHATIQTSLFVGTHSLTASFFGVSGFAASTSDAAAVTVNSAATTVALKSSVNPAVTGQAVTFTATVAAVAPGAGTPTGLQRRRHLRRQRADSHRAGQPVMRGEALHMPRGWSRVPS
jgi:hypothetical protein